MTELARFARSLIKQYGRTKPVVRFTLPFYRRFCRDGCTVELYSTTCENRHVILASTVLLTFDLSDSIYATVEVAVSAITSYLGTTASPSLLLVKIVCAACNGV